MRTAVGVGALVAAAVGSLMDGTWWEGLLVALGLGGGVAFVLAMIVITEGGSD